MDHDRHPAPDHQLPTDRSASPARPEDVEASRDRLSDESGFSTAELLGNAALGILALVAIWGLLQALGMDIVTWIRAQLLGG
jgi:hypothetical protein